MGLGLQGVGQGRGAGNAQEHGKCGLCCGYNPHSVLTR